MEFAQMTLKTGSPSYSNSNAFQKKEHVKNLNKKITENYAYFRECN